MLAVFLGPWSMIWADWGPFRHPGRHVDDPWVQGVTRQDPDHAIEVPAVPCGLGDGQMGRRRGVEGTGLDTAAHTSMLADQVPLWRHGHARVAPSSRWTGGTGSAMISATGCGSWRRRRIIAIHAAIHDHLGT